MRPAEPRPGWPSGVKPISIDGLDALGVSDDGYIYWDGKRIVTEKRLTLSMWQKIGAILTVLATLVIAAESALNILSRY